MPTLANLALRLRKLRAQFELTQQQVADLVSIDYKYYQRIETGKQRHMWLDTAERLAAVYQLELWQLLHPDFLRHAKQPKMGVGSMGQLGRRK